METRGVMSCNEQMQEFHQKFVCYKKQSDKKFKVIEELIEEAASKMEILKQRKMRRRRSYKFVNSCDQEITSELRQDTPLHHLRWQFPKWKDHMGVKEWLESCEHYFDIFQVGECKKVAIAGRHLEDTDRTWFQTYIVGRKDWSWTEFCSQLEARFGMWEHDWVYANSKQLQQLITVESYYSQFENCMAQLMETVTDSKKFSLGSDISKPQTKEVFKDSAAWKNYIGEPIYEEGPIYDEEDSEVFDCEQQWADFGIGNRAQEWTKITEKLPDVDVAPETYYTVEPIYDEEPGENKEDWHSEDIICIALGLEDFFQLKQNLEEGNSSGSNMLECTSEFGPTPREVKSDNKDEPTESRPEFQMPKELIASIKLDELRLLTTPCCISICQGVNSSKANVKESKDMKLWSFGHVPGHCDKPNIVGSYKVEEKQGANEEEFSIIPTNTRKSAEAFEKSPTAKNSYGLSKKYSNYSKTNVLVFDPGGSVKNDHSTSSIDMFEEMIKNKGKLDEAAVINSFGGDQIDQVVSEITEQNIDSRRAGMMARPYRCIVLRQDSLGNVMRFKVKETWKRKQIITIFDPGGELDIVRSTMRTWLFSKEGDMSGTD